MRALFCHDTFYSYASGNKKGAVYAHGAFPYRLWQERYLPLCDELVVIGREYHAQPTLPSGADHTRPFENRGEGGLDRSDGPGVRFCLLPSISGARAMLKNYSYVRKMLEDQIHQADLLILRGPSEFGLLAASLARNLGKFVALEMSGCAFDHTFHHGSIAGKMYAPLKLMRARKLVQQADAVIYVTQAFLQKRYPAHPQALVAVASNVEIPAPETTILDRRLQKIANMGPRPLKIGLLGHVNNRLKGLGVALQALGHAQKMGLNFHFHILGKGYPDMWQREILAADLQDKVVFDGAVAGGQAVWDWLDDIDILIHPSLHEGLPRAVIEACARGCPVLGSDVAGLPELLPPDRIHKRRHAKQLATQLHRLAHHTDILAADARRNFETARLYGRDVLVPIRQAFWGEVRGRIDRKKKDGAPA